MFILRMQERAGFEGFEGCKSFRVVGAGLGFSWGLKGSRYA